MEDKDLKDLKRELKVSTGFENLKRMISIICTIKKILA